MSNTSKHEVTFKLEEMIKDVDKASKAVGYGCAVRYKGPNEDGITPNLACAIIHSALQETGMSEKEREDVMNIVCKKVIPSCSKAVTSKASSLEKAMEKIAEKAKEEDNNNDEDDDCLPSPDVTIGKMLLDKKWAKVLLGKSKFDLSVPLNRQVLAWICTALAVAEKYAGKRASKSLARLFLEDVIDDEEEDKDAKLD